MAILLMNRTNLDTYLSRIRALRADSKRLWGQLDAASMLAHLTLTAQVSMGEIAAPDSSSLFSRKIGVRIAYSNWMPWPKGRIKVPAEWTPVAKDSLEEERGRAIAALIRFVELSESQPGRRHVHPMFGPLTLRFWQQVHGKHTHHHCTQFGV